MPHPHRRHVLKYFEPVDRFLRIAVLGAHELGSDGRSPADGGSELDGAAYRREVVRACVGESAAVAPCLEDAEDAVERLYRLCVEVNPSLELHSVTLEERVEPPPATAPRRSRGPDGRTRLRRRMHGLETRLRGRVFGQGPAIERVARALRRSAAGLAEPERPLGSFLLLGPTGTGKTELARALADELFAGELVRIDCSEYAQAHETSRLLGAPPGYVGYDQGGVLAEALQRAPASLVLFDEIEKAHTHLHHLLLQVLDDGRLSDHRGRVVRFDQAVVVLTSNAGARELAAAHRPTGFARGAPSAAALSAVAASALEGRFPPEFLARLDERITFAELNATDLVAVARRQLALLAQRVRSGSGARVAFSRGVAPWLARGAGDSPEGARGLRRRLRQEVEAPLADELLRRRDARPFLRASVRRGRMHFAPAD